MKKLIDKFNRIDLLNSLLSNFAKGQINSVSQSNDDINLLSSVINNEIASIVHITVAQLTDNFIGEQIWLFTLDGKKMILEDFDCFEDGQITLYGEEFTGENIYFSEINLHESDFINVMVSNDSPLCIKNQKIKINNLDEDLKWLLT